VTRYHTIVADPPWRVKAGRALEGYVMRNGKQIFNPVNNKTRDLAYPTMKVDEICKLPVREWAEDDSHLYLWTINAYLDSAFDVMRAWGFTYSTTLVWCKRPLGGGLGGCYRLATEFVLFGRRGKLSAESVISRNWFDWKRPYDERGKPKHSAKPPQFYSMVESVSPSPRLEMFARAPREGWSVWGNEVTQ
jgi:N6-adenosine-specific RNA methylase IME4